MIDAALLERLYREARADRWHLPEAAFAYTLEASCNKAFSGSNPSRREVSRFLSSLHLEDLALACACAEGHAAAWDHFVLEYRPHLYRAADVIDPSGRARELADSMYAELYGIDARGEARQSLLRYFHGRSSLATWLRAVLAQRHVDRVRAARRTEQLPDDLPDVAAGARSQDPDCGRYSTLLRSALGRALSGLPSRDRLRLSLYYAERLTLAELGRLLKEHEATASRHLARTRKAVRAEVERDLRAGGLGDAQIKRCFECASEDVGDMSLEEMLDVQEIGPGSFNMKR